jgi:hypothetical protein
MNDFITMNFFPLETLDFYIPIYKKECGAQETKKDFSFPVKAFSLFTENPSEEKIMHFVTFDRQDNFIEGNILSSDDHHLTIWYLSYLIKRKCEILSLPCVIQDDFIGIIDFIMDDTELGQENICIIPSYKNRKYGIILDYHFNINKNIPYSLEMQKKSLSLDRDGRSNKNYYGDKYDKIINFINSSFDNIFRPIDENNQLFFSRQMDNIECHKLTTKNYIFGGGNKSNSQFNGIMKSGPFSNIKGECMFGFIFKNNEKPLSHELYYALRGDRFATFKGMEKMFGICINKDNVIGEEIIDYNETEINRIVDNIINRSKGKSIVPIILVPWNKETASELDNKMYFYIKYKFLKEGIACQFVSIDKIKNNNTFKWIVSGIALQIFTKLGGSPWCLVPSTEKCLIIGIGQAHRKNENKEIERYYSYSIQNDSSGLFKDIKILSDSTDHKKYLDGLSIRLKEIITSQIDNFNSFVIHTSFRLRKDEMDTIKTTIELLAGEKADKKFAVVRFNDDHHFMGYDLSNNSLTPYESSVIRISAKSYLIWFEGLQYGYSSVKERIGPPVKIDLDYPQNYSREDSFRYLQDAINLSGANWRGFNAKSMPVSVLYAHLLSKFIAAFDNYNYTDINIENITPWFL